MAGTYVGFHHFQLLWLVPLGMMVVFNNPCLDEVTSSCTFAVQVTTVMSNGKRCICCSKRSGLLWGTPTSYSVGTRGVFIGKGAEL